MGGRMFLPENRGKPSGNAKGLVINNQFLKVNVTAGWPPSQHTEYQEKEEKQCKHLQPDVKQESE